MASKNLMDVTLPSKGLAYDSIPAKMTLKSITVKEEKMIFGSTQSDGPERALRACIVEPSNLDMRELLPQDEHFLLIKLRIHTFGPEYKVTATCPECGKKFDMTVNLDELDIIELPDDFKEPIELKMPNGKDILGLRLLRNLDNDAIEDQAKKRAKAFNEDIGEIEYVLKMARMIKTINGEEVTIQEAQEYVESMTSRDSAYFNSVIDDEFSFGFDSIIECSCPKCGDDIQFGLPISSEFFRPKFKRIK